MVGTWAGLYFRLTHVSTQQTIAGGQFLTHSISPDEIFTREDLPDEHRLFGRTAAEFMRNEVTPNEARIFAHDWDLTRELLRKAADIDLLRLPIPEAHGGVRPPTTHAHCVS